ncbi:uncharacterized protein LOC121924325 [Sceloporus undulatus]|uniref:uncharacterized protein LOC121924325 n=1 Tax=Sceloporus undulatus TaxID=8520 RepID=UPI001C4D1589|nr:uncharacterized protein LOC121924325 [Sceloporus undulatus]XP_042311626.1 uncharacterized protein LOC121924325 [Sceloporus undulatus]XP_042311627.1 uncharacterized protein LOC121924325 [Sceloporus undulatus]XP_042311628.1 uncharacterized protein LOC121924325 [Sceloporus undulatus]XP_042311629.1 uncharacterized protein LOC121924325 [Sceloporus undulatus]
MGACIPKELPPAPLNVDSLLSAQNSLETDNRETDEMLSACLDHALRDFPREPHRLRENATLTIQVKGRKRMEFVSGRGENKIVVSWFKRKTHYNIEIVNLEVYLDRLSFSPRPLTVESLEKVKQELIKWSDATKELRACLDVAITEIEKEPPTVKNDAELTIECGGFCLDFISGKGKSHIYILFSDKQPRYRVHVPSVDVYLDRLSYRAIPLTTENLMKVWKEAENLKGCTVDLRACLKRALQEFNALSPHHRANTTIFIDCDGKNFKMVSGHGESWISIFNILGDQHCRREVVLALGEAGTSSRATGSSSGKRGKEGALFRARKSEGRRDAEEGTSNQARRTSSRPNELLDEKISKKWPTNVIKFEELASNSTKREKETTSFGAWTFSTQEKVDTGVSNSFRVLERDSSLKSKEQSSSKKRKLSDNDGTERELTGSLSLSSETAREEVLIHGKNEETRNEMRPSNTSSDTEEEEEGLEEGQDPPDVLQMSSDSRQGDDGPER